MRVFVHTWLAGTREVLSLATLSDVRAGAVVSTRTVVAGVELFTKNSSVAVFTLTVESALQVAIVQFFN